MKQSSMRRAWHITVLPQSRQSNFFMRWHTAYVLFKLSDKEWSKPQLLLVKQDSSGKVLVKPFPGPRYWVYYPGEIRIIENIRA